MKLFKTILLFALLYLGIDAAAQTAVSSNNNPVLNKTDINGKKNGLWLISQQALRGEPAYSEFGNYAHGNKIGKWYKMDDEGELVAIENYKYNVLDGEVKYFDKGQLTIIGHYRSLNPAYPYDTIVVTDPVSGLERLAYAPTDKGTLRHGIWRYYDPQTGRLVKEQEYQVDSLIYEKEFTLSKTDSLYYEKRNKSLPHLKSEPYTPPKSKQFSILD
ncbi:MAG TPA: hypothetical protein VN721_01610 [Flavipsychrobacter sp.]|nr:hypothetical protein [Flavipsychrobacter sp.]